MCFNSILSNNNLFFNNDNVFAKLNSLDKNSGSDDIEALF